VKLAIPIYFCSRSVLLLPPYVVADLYRRRWRLREAFHTVKRLLGLSYGLVLLVIKLQKRLLGYFLCGLVDLEILIADELSLPFDRISLEMIYRGLYHFSVAQEEGKPMTLLNLLPQNQT